MLKTAVRRQKRKKPHDSLPTENRRVLSGHLPHGQIIAPSRGRSVHRCRERLVKRRKAKFDVIRNVQTNFCAIVLNYENFGIREVALCAQLERCEKRLEVMPAVPVASPVTELIAAIAGVSVFDKNLHRASWIKISGENSKRDWAKTLKVVWNYSG